MNLLKTSQVIVDASTKNAVSRYQVSLFWLFMSVPSRFLELDSKVSSVEDDSFNWAKAAVLSFKVSCANCDLESSPSIIVCVRRRARVTSLLALTSFSSLDSSV